MMTDEVRERAHSYLESFYERKKEIWQNSIDAAQEADANMTKVLAVPPPAKTLNDQVIANLFSFALTIVFPAATVMTKAAFEKYKDSVGRDGDSRVLLGIINSGIRMAQQGYPAPSADLARAKSRIAAITTLIAGLAALKAQAQREHEEAREKLLEKAFKDKWTTYTLAQITSEIGPLPDLVDKEKFARLVYIFEYGLWQQYVQNHVTLIVYFGLNDLIEKFDTNGINKIAYGYLVSRFQDSIRTEGGLEWRPIRSYQDLRIVWFCDMHLERTASRGTIVVSPELRNEIKSVRQGRAAVAGERLIIFRGKLGIAKKEPQWPPRGR